MLNEAERLLEIGKLYCDRGDYGLALPNLQNAAKSFLTEKKYDSYLKATQYILRIQAEKENHEEITTIKDQLHDLVIHQGINLNSKTYYTLGVCANYKGQIESSLDYFKRALELSVKSNSQEDMCHAILGLSICYRQQKKYDEALKELNNLNIILRVLNISELKVSSANSQARILMDQKKYDQALEHLWVAYDETKKSKQLNTVIIILENIGTCLYELNQRETAQIYLNLAARSIDPENNKYFLKRISKYLENSNQGSEFGNDLIFDLEKHSVIEKNIGSIDFKNQFILLDLLKLFITNQGKIYSKEYLVENVWKQHYDPTVHDNKIYVTIKRLRKLIEPDYDKPKYIFRAKNGYYLSKSTKVHFKASKTEGVL